MDEGLRTAIAHSDPEAKRPPAIETLIDMARNLQRFAQQALAQPEPDRREAEKLMKLAHDIGRSAVRFLPPGGELRRRLESGQLTSEEEWERFCGPSILQDWRR
jgi:hypothetical protein